MSRSITAEVTVNLQQQLMEAVVASPRSKLVNDLANPLLGTGRSTRLQDGSALGVLTARTDALAAHPGWVAAVEQAASGLLGQSRRLLADSKSELARGNTSGSALLAQQGDNAMRQALRTTASHLAVQERQQAAVVVERALTTIGCRTTLREKHGLSGLSAERQHQRLVALIEDGGLVRLDIAGCEGDVCEPLQRDFEKAVREHGGTLEQVESNVHGDNRGGALIQRAALAAGQDTLADGVIRQAMAQRRTDDKVGVSVVLEPLTQGH